MNSAQNSIKIAPVIFLNGGDSYVHAEKLRQLISAARQALPDIEINYFSGGEVDLIELQSALEGDLFTASSMVVVEQMEDASPEIVTALVDLTKKHAVETVGKDGENILIMSRSVGAKGSRISTQFAKNGAEILTTPTLKKDKERVDYVLKFFKDRGAAIDFSAVQMLVEGYGMRTGDLISACTRLSDEMSLDEKRSTITIEQVKALPGLATQATGFDIIKKALDGHVANVLIMLRQALYQEEESIVLLAAFSYKIRQLALFAAHPNRDTLSPNIRKCPSLYQKIMNQMRAQMGGFTSERFARCLDALANVDDSFKSGNGDVSYELERAVKIIGAKGSS